MPPLCAHCGKLITGKYLKDHWGNPYCAVHMKTATRCDYCGRFIGEKLTHGGKKYTDGRKICGLCLGTAVNNPGEGLRLLEKVRAALETEGIVIRPFKPEFFLISRSKLRELDRDGGEKQGFATFRRTIVNGKITEFQMNIYILSGLPESTFIAACAHELMHIWFYSRNITDVSAVLIEGSCQMAAFLVLSKQKNPEAAYRIKELFADKSRTYGAGFRKAHSLAGRKGVNGWLKHIATHKRF